MSAEQWGGSLWGNEAYDAAPSFCRFRDSAFRHILPAHQGRANVLNS